MPLVQSELFRTAFAISAVCLAVAVIISSLEYFTMLRQFNPRGALSWSIFEEDSRRFSALATLRSATFGVHGTAVLLSFRMLCAVALLFDAIRLDHWICLFALAGVVVTGIVLNYRVIFTLEGSDAMSTIVAAGLLVAVIDPSSVRWQMLGLGFIAAQSCLSYLASGASKAASPVWRNGTAVYKILNTATNGHPIGARLLRGNPTRGLILCWSVIVFEILFSLSLVMPSKAALALIAGGVIFHLCNALFMGLNVFFWSYTATYPTIWFCHFHLRSVLASFVSHSGV